MLLHRARLPRFVWFLPLWGCAQVELPAADGGAIAEAGPVDAAAADAAADAPSDARSDARSADAAADAAHADAGEVDAARPPPAPGCPGTRDCAGRVCGLDPNCATSCGACADGLRCDGGRCLCVPDCSRRRCGPDGCGDICGTCGADQFCSDGGCEPLPPSCPGAAECGRQACGPDPVCGTECGPCARDQVCRESRCVCVPQCRGAQCGPDGCGGECGACGEGAECTDGRCVCPGVQCGGACCGEGEGCVDGRCCPTPWRHDLPGDTLAQAVRGDDGVLYVVGTVGDAARVTAFDACGEVLADVPVAHPRFGATSGMAIASLGADLLIGGAVADADEDPQQGFWARLSTPDLRARWSNSLTGGPFRDEVWGLVPTLGGRVWMSGAASQVDDTTLWWAIIGDTGGRACGWSAAPGSVGAGRQAVFDPARGRVFMTGSVEGRLAVRGFAEGCAGQVPPCGCEPQMTYRHELLDGEIQADGRDLRMRGGLLYVAGFTMIDAGSQGTLLRLDPDTGALRGATRWNPTPAFDGFLSLESTGRGLVAGGARGFDGQSWATATATLLLLSDGLALLDERGLGPGHVVHVLAAGDDAVFVLSNRPDGAGNVGVVRRCPIAADCP